MKVALRLIVSLAFIAAIFSGCFRDPSVRKQKYFESGQRYFEKGKYPEASIQFLNALKIDSNYAAAHYQLAQSYLKMQQPGRAFPELARAVEVIGRQLQAQVLDVADRLLKDPAWPLLAPQPVEQPAGFGQNLDVTGRPPSASRLPSRSGGRR